MEWGSKMSVNNKKDYAESLGCIAREFLEYIEEEFPDSYTFFSDKIQESVLNLLDIEKPKVMVYGIYNSGKSTLINSLCKSEVAKMADRPMTDRISEYDHGDYYLIDSPGVDAPIEHELVTEEYINKCHVILFVISSKGVFEDRTNYKKLARLIESNIPFIIVLNERGVSVKDLTAEQKKKVKFEHEQELRIIQYKIIDNLIKESNNKKIAEQYEVVVLNAKKALIGILKEKHSLYEGSNVGFLEKRITQLLSNDNSIISLLKQPISNLEECFNKVEKVITQTISGNLSEDFSIGLHIMESKMHNIMQDLRILVQQVVYSYLQELTNAYVNGDSNIFESVANAIFMEIDDRYSAKINELFVHVDHRFKDLDIQIDTNCNLVFSSIGLTGSSLKMSTEELTSEGTDALPPEKKGLFDIFKSRRRREREKRERLEMEARLKNEQAQYRVQEQIRRKQEARQLAFSDLNELNRSINSIVSKDIYNKYDYIISQIQQVDQLNKQLLDKGNRQMKGLHNIREKLITIENDIG